MATCTNSGNHAGPFLLPLSGLGTRPGNEAWERGLGTRPGNEAWERGLGTRPGNEAWERGLGTRPGNEAWERGLGTRPGNEAWERGLGTRLGENTHKNTWSTQQQTFPLSPFTSSCCISEKLFNALFMTATMFSAMILSDSSICGSWERNTSCCMVLIPTTLCS